MGEEEVEFKSRPQIQRKEWAGWTEPAIPMDRVEMAISGTQVVETEG